MTLSTPDTDKMLCVAVLTLPDAKRLVWSLAAEGIKCLVTRDGSDKRRWHVAVDELTAASPIIWLLSLRDADPTFCKGDPSLKHPVAVL